MFINRDKANKKVCRCRQAGVGGGERADYLIGSESARAEIEISSRVALMREYDAEGAKLDCTQSSCKQILISNASRSSLGGILANV
jgi:hypothetical protein